VVSFNSDSAELGRRLNGEAAKAVKYGDVAAEEALKFVTLNAARQLAVDAHVGSLESGKQADLVVWSGPPLSAMSRCEQTWIDGRKYFDVTLDRGERESILRMRAALVQRILASGETMRAPGETDGTDRGARPPDDAACHCHVGPFLPREHRP
jgi:N-acetylglucosamine-6-phosphate deacetylase